MRGDDLNEWQILRQDDEHDSLTMEPAVEKRGSQLLFQFPEKRLSLPINIRRAVSPAKQSRASTPLWQVLTPETMLSRRFADSRQSFKTVKVRNNCNEAIIRTSTGKIRSVRLSEEVSNRHLNNLVLQLSNPQVKIEPTIVARPPPSVIRIRKPEFNYKALKIKADQGQSTPSRSCMPKSSHLHSRKYSQLYHEAVKKELQRKQALKKIPRRKRKKQMARVSPEAPKALVEQKFQVKPQPLRKDRKMLNFRIEERKSLSRQPELISESTLFQILKLRREIKLGILTNT